MLPNLKSMHSSTAVPLCLCGPLAISIHSSVIYLLILAKRQLCNLLPHHKHSFLLGFQWGVAFLHRFLRFINSFNQLFSYLNFLGHIPSSPAAWHRADPRGFVQVTDRSQYWKSPAMIFLYRGSIHIRSCAQTPHWHVNVYLVPLCLGIIIVSLRLGVPCGARFFTIMGHFVVASRQRGYIHWYSAFQNQLWDSRLSLEENDALRYLGVINNYFMHEVVPFKRSL